MKWKASGVSCFFDCLCYDPVVHNGNTKHSKFNYVDIHTSGPFEGEEEQDGFAR